MIQGINLTIINRAINDYGIGLALLCKGSYINPLYPSGVDSLEKIVGSRDKVSTAFLRELDEADAVIIPERMEIVIMTPFQATYTADTPTASGLTAKLAGIYLKELSNLIESKDRTIMITAYKKSDNSIAERHILSSGAGSVDLKRGDGGPDAISFT
ncbi:MAG: hypothetical protein ACRCXT_12195 [Paraclostridium sp.]